MYMEIPEETPNASPPIPLFNYSVAALVSPMGADHFPVHLDARLGGTLNFVYPAAVGALVIALALIAFLKRSKQKEVKK